MIICIDSQIIIWGLKKQADPGSEHMIALAENFFLGIDKNETQVIIPTIVVAEILTREPATIRGRIMEVLNNNFILVNFDARAALKYGELLHGRYEQAKQRAAANSVDRQRMKADHMIIATALVNGANCIYSYDRGLTSFAQGYIDVRTFPPPPAQQFDLFQGTQGPA